MAETPGRSIEKSGYSIRLDLSCQKLHLDFTFDDYDESCGNREETSDDYKGTEEEDEFIFDDYDESGDDFDFFPGGNGDVIHNEAAYKNDEYMPAGGSAKLYPTLSSLRAARSHRPPLISASLLALKAKQFDDGLYAAAELSCQDGVGDFPGKKWLIESLLANRDLPPGSATGVAAILYSAAEIGGLDLEVPDTHQKSVRAAHETFINNQLRSKPISFYTWTGQLKRIFMQDRALQQAIKDPVGAAIIGSVLSTDQEVGGAYKKYINFVARLTNPSPPEISSFLLFLVDPKNHDIILDPDTFHFFPPARSHEMELMKKLYGDKEIPGYYHLIDDLIKRVEAKEISLAPTEDSGWYDYQVWSFLPLIATDDTAEAQKLSFGEDYRKHLTELFKSFLAMARETHIKQLEIAALGGAFEEPGEKPEIYITPGITVEPLFSHYLYRAVSYRFIKKNLVDFFGEDGVRKMNRQTADGPVEMNLLDELDEMESFFLGAMATVGGEIGLSGADLCERLYYGLCHDFNLETAPLTESAQSLMEKAKSFSEWAESGDADLAADCRMMIPLFYDLKRQRTKVLATIGWAKRPLSISYKENPNAVVTDSSGADVTDNVILHFTPQESDLAYPVTVELYVDRILDRSQFRELCDECKTQEEIVGKLA